MTDRQWPYWGIAISGCIGLVSIAFAFDAYQVAIALGLMVLFGVPSGFALLMMR